VPDTIKPGTILIKEGALLPETMRFESESCLPGWRLVKDLDGRGLDRKSEKRDGPSSAWLVSSERPPSVLTNKRLPAGHLSKSWRTWSRRNLTPWKSCEWPRRPQHVSWSALCDCVRSVATYSGKHASFPGQGPSGEGSRTIDGGLKQNPTCCELDFAVHQYPADSTILDVSATWKQIANLQTRGGPDEVWAWCLIWCRFLEAPGRLGRNGQT